MSKKLFIDYIPKKKFDTAGKVERFEIEINKNYGLLSDPNDGHAKVITFFSHKEFKSSGVAETVTSKRIVAGPPNEVYHYHYNRTNAARDLFLKAWKTAKDKNFSHLTAFPYKPAYINEKLSEFIQDKYYGGAKEFAEKTNRNYANIHKEIQGKRQISHKQAIEYAKALNIDPVDLLFEKQKTKLWAEVNFLNRIGTSTDYYYRPGQLKFFGEDKFVTVPRDIYKPNIRCVTVNTKGSHLDRHNLFYYKSDDKRPEGCHGKLCLVGVDVVIDGQFDYTEYFIGIYEEAIGGKVNLINPDPFAEQRYILTDIQNIYAVAPIVAVINPSLLKQKTYEEIDFSKLAALIEKEDKKRLKEQNKIVSKVEEDKKIREIYLKQQEEIDIQLRKLEQKHFEILKNIAEAAEEKKRA